MRITLSSIKEAYLQLKRHLYYERLDLDARNRIVEFENEYDFDINGRLSTIDSWIKKYSNSDGLGKPVDALIAEIDLNVFVKKISRTDDLNTSNFITDKIHTSNFKLEKEHTFISIPVELQILGALWVNSIGINLDRKLIKHCYGNRLIKYDEAQDLSLNGRLFKIYHFQYARWWKTGLKKAKEILRKDKEDALILNFDLKSFYHSVCVNKQQLRTKIQYDKLSTKEKYLHRILEAVLDEYNQRLRKTKLDKNQEDWALPIGYLPSPLIANDYLDLFDKDIVKNVRPSYYGRYVDDIMVVFKSGTPKDSFARLKDEKSIAELNKLDKTDESREAVYRFLKYLGDRFIISKSESGTKIEIKGVKGAELQLEKLFVYELDRKSPSNLIESFIQDQNSKSYEFQFESEENDTVSKEFGNLLFTQSFEQEEASNAKIKRITQNKFEISVFLSRLIRRSTSSDAYVHRDQLKSVVSYYKGANCIESWTLWEKIILATVVNNDDQLFLKFINFCADSIESLASNINNDSKSRILIEHFENSMWMILEIAISNSIAANPKFIESDEISKFIEDYSLNLNHRGIRSAAFVRNEFTAFPLLGLTDEAIGSDVSYFSRKEISKFIESHLLSIRECFLEYSPVRVKYWQVCHLEWLNRLQQLKWKAGDEINTVTIEDELNFKKVQLPAFEKYFKINYKSRKDPHTIRKKYFFKVGEPKNGIDGPKKEELHVIASELKEKLRFGLVNEHVDKNHITEAAKGQLDLDGRLENCYRILDEVQSKGCDIAVQPELSVPFDYLWNYFAYSERHQLGLVSGIEHKRIRDVVFNFIMTVLPIKVEGVYNDAIPVMRLKNHFAPSEEEMIRGFRATVPKPAVYRYHLLHWRGLYFTNYYCYELADIKHRHIFQGEVDVLIAPVWNPDTNYYNGIVETGAREVHCVFSQVNTAEYGDTRWTIPAKTELKNPLKVKGGTTTDHPFTIALSDFNPKKLREFQNLGYNAQKKNGNYKPTPPNFPKDKAVKDLTKNHFMSKNRVTSNYKYHSYKDSGEYWMGDIPKHWDIKKLKHVFKEKKKVTNPSLNCGSISFGKVVYKDDEKVPESTKASYQEVLAGEYLVNPLNLNYDLISLRIGLSEINVVVSSGYIVLKNVLEIDKSYFNYLLHRYDVAYMKLLGSGVRQTISFNHIANSLLAYPPKEEQTAIAAFLDDKTTKIDRAIAQKEQLIALLKERKQIIIQNAVTKGLDPKVKLKDSGVEWIGEIPEHWEILPGLRFFSENKRNNKGMKESTVLSLSYGNIIIKPLEKLVGLVPESFETYQIVEPGDIIIRCTDLQNDQTSLRTGLAKDNGIITSAYLNLKVQGENTSEYLHAFLHFLDTTKVLYKFGSGLRQNLSFLDFKRMEIPKVPILEQEEILKYIETQSNKIEESINQFQTQIGKLKEYKATLIDSAVTGKIKVS